MGIQINGSTDTISAVDGSLSLEGGELRTVSGLNVTGVVTATSYQGDGSALTGIDATQIVTGDTSVQTVDTGSDGTIKFNTDGSERARIDSSGRFGIGTNSPARPLDIVSDSGARAIQVRGRSSDNIGLIDFYSNDGATRYAVIGAPAAGQFAIETGNTERVRIDDSGRLLVGVSISSADARLVVAGSTTPYDSQILMASTGNQPSADTKIGGIKWSDNRHDSNIGAEISCFSDASWGGSVAPGRLVFSTTASGAASPTERMVIDSSGRLLVGTSSVGAGDSQYSKLQVVGNSLNNEGFFRIARNTATGSMAANDVLARMFFTDSSGGRYGQIDCFCDGTPGTNDYPGRLVFSTTADGASSPTERMRIDSEGVVRCGNNLTLAKRDANSIGMKIGTSHPQTALEIETATGGTRYNIRFWQGTTESGRIETNGSSTTYATSSDYRLKENIVPVTNGIERLQQLNPSRFNFIANPSRTVDGFLAHEVQGVVPEAISGEKDAVEVWQEGEELPDGVSIGDNKLDEDGNTIPKYQGIDQSKLVPLLTAALQEAIGKIETLETANASQAATIAALDARLTALEGGN